MNFLLYATVTDGPGERLQKVIEAMVREEKVEIYRTIHNFSRRLRQPARRPAIAVLFAATRKDLLDLLSLGDLLDDVRVILVLPDGQDDTIAKAHTLRPRFLTYSDSDFADVAAVLNKMLGNTYPEKKSSSNKGR